LLYYIIMRRLFRRRLLFTSFHFNIGWCIWFLSFCRSSILLQLLNLFHFSLV
jgi:hypothetical protein